jgi:hypothetical protein
MILSGQLRVGEHVHGADGTTITVAKDGYVRRGKRRYTSFWHALGQPTCFAGAKTGRKRKSLHDVAMRSSSAAELNVPIPVTPRLIAAPVEESVTQMRANEDVTYRNLAYRLEERNRECRRVCLRERRNWVELVAALLSPTEATLAQAEQVLAQAKQSLYPSPPPPSPVKKRRQELPVLSRPPPSPPSCPKSSR